MFPINWLRQLSTPFLGPSCPASRQQVSFKPELEFLEARIVPAGDPQALPFVAHDALQVAVDYGKGNYDSIKLKVDQAILSTPLAGALGVSTKTVENDQFTLGLDKTELLLDMGQLGKALGAWLGWPGYSLATFSITSFVVSPKKPAAGEDVTATASISGAPANTPAALSVQGTDGYTDSKTVEITGSGSVSLDIPGGAAGVTDTITLSVPGLGTMQEKVVYS